MEEQRRGARGLRVGESGLVEDPTAARWGREVPPSAPPLGRLLEKPTCTLLAQDLVAEERFEGLAMRASDRHLMPEAGQRPVEQPSWRAGSKLIHQRDIEPEESGERLHGLDTPGVGTRRDAIDAVRREHLRQPDRVGAAQRVEAPIAIAIGRQESFTSAGMS